MKEKSHSACPWYAHRYDWIILLIPELNYFIILCLEQKIHTHNPGILLNANSYCLYGKRKKTCLKYESWFFCLFSVNFLWWCLNCIAITISSCAFTIIFTKNKVKNHSFPSEACFLTPVELAHTLFHLSKESPLLQLKA